jgi:murein L,D-transpeptidase YafK
MRRCFAFVVFAVVVLLSSLAGARPPKATRIEVKKSAHEMRLFDGDQLLATYTVSIGPGGAGPKQREGDRVTPVGEYHITWKGPSRFNTFMLLDYPNAQDRARFAKLKAEGKIPKSARIGGDVGIHGAGPVYAPGDEIQDWTLGCVAVDDEQIKEVASFVSVGTPVHIED